MVHVVENKTFMDIQIYHILSTDFYLPNSTTLSTYTKRVSVRQQESQKRENTTRTLGKKNTAIVQTDRSKAKGKSQKQVIGHGQNVKEGGLYVRVNEYTHTRNCVR